MRVAIVMPLAEQRGGAELMLLHLLRASQTREDIDYVVVFLEHGPMVGEVRALGYVVLVIPADRLRRPIAFFRTVATLAKRVRQERIQVLLSWMPKGHLYAGLAAKLVHIPAVWFQHGIPTGHWIDRVATMIPAAGIFCCSEAAATRQRGLFPRRPTHVTYPAVDLLRFAPERLPTITEARKHVGLPQGKVIVGMVSRLQRQKGVHVFIEAAALLAKERSDLCFVVVGGEDELEPNYLSTLEEQVLEMGLEGRFLLAGYQADVPLWIQTMDVLVQASITPEGFGMVLIEGLALEKAVVGTREGGPAEIIRDGEGILVPPGDSVALAHALRTLADDDVLRERLGEVGRIRARQFTTERLAASAVEGLHTFVDP
jgi:glycosyltransferase involved in cell wall biosynthesis